MGILSGAAGILSTAADVASGVTKLGSNALSMGAKFIKSWPGKIAVGIGVAGLLTANPNNPGGTLFGKITSGLKGLLSSAKDAIGNFIGTGATKTVASVAAGVTNAGMTANQYGTEMSQLIATGAAAHGEASPATLAAAQPEAAPAPAPEAGGYEYEC